MIKRSATVRPISLNCRRSAVRPAVYGAICLATITIIACTDRNKSPADVHWDSIVNGESNEAYYIDRKAIKRVSGESVKVTVKYAPAKGQFLISLQGLSKEFGSSGQNIEQEYTVSTWEFNCEKPEGRCLNLTHFKKGKKIASYEYPHPTWTPLHNAPGTKTLRDVVCAEVSKSGK